jgi:hypothetical protein
MLLKGQSHGGEGGSSEDGENLRGGSSLSPGIGGELLGLLADIAVAGDSVPSEQRLRRFASGCLPAPG